MAAIRIASEKVVVTIQWALAIVLFEAGLAQAGLPVELQLRLGLAGDGDPGGAIAGLVQAVAAVLLVVPSATGFVPGLAPLSAVAVALAFGATASGYPVPVAPGAPSVAAAVALAAAAVAVARAVVLPVPPVGLGPEVADPLRRPTEQRIRRHGRSVVRTRSAEAPRCADASP